MELPVRILREPQLLSPDSKLPSDWKREHDPAMEIVVTPVTLLFLKQYTGSIVQVQGMRHEGAPQRLARIVVAPGSGLKDHVAYLSPVLAFNLRLSHHIEELLRSMEPDEDASMERVQSHLQASTSSSGPAPPAQPFTQLLKVKISAIEQESIKKLSADQKGELLQAGCRAAGVRLATSLTLEVVKVPHATLLSSQTDADEEQKPPGAASSQPAASQVQGDAAEKGVPFLDESSFTSEQVSEDMLSLALQQYLKQRPRVLAEGDLFAVPTSDAHGNSELIASLFSCDVPVLDLVYFQVQSIQPAWHTSQLVDPDKTSVMLKGACNSAVPPGLPEFLQTWTEMQKTEQLNKDDSGKGRNSTSRLHTPRSQNTRLPLWKEVDSILAPAFHPFSHQILLRTTLLVVGAEGIGKQSAVQAAAQSLGVHVIPFPCQELQSGSDAKTAAALKMAHGIAQDFAPAVLLLRDIPTLLDKSPITGGQESGVGRLAAALMDCVGSTGAGEPQHQGKATQWPLLVVGTAQSSSDIPALLRRCFTHELTAEAPDTQGRQALLSSLLVGSSRLSSGALPNAATQTAGLLPADLNTVAADCVAQAVARLTDACNMLTLASSPDCRGDEKAGRVNENAETAAVQDSDLDTALQRIRKRTAASIGTPQVPNVKWEDVGGLDDVKEAILETVELPLKHPELFANGLRRRSGLLLYGPPGTGKTLIAKAVATECSLNFLSVKGPELINMYIGESERQVREVFERARRARPCVLFFDELDSLAPARGGGADSAGVMDRVVSQLLAEVDGISGGGKKSGSQDIFLIGATNRPDLLDTSLMRPGRLDKLLYVGIAQDPVDKLKVLQALTRKFELGTAVDLPSIAERCPATLTGADLYALCADAWMGGLRRCTSSQGLSDAAVTIEIEHRDFELALSSLTPSISQDELARYQNLRKQYQSI